MTAREQTLMATRGTVPDTLTIGVVEDDPSFLRALRRLLSGAGFSVATFASAEEFLASESAGGTACLVLDVHLGGMNGFDLQQQLAAAGRLDSDDLHHRPRRSGHARARAIGRGLPPEALPRRGAGRGHPEGARFPWSLGIRSYRIAHSLRPLSCGAMKNPWARCLGRSSLLLAVLLSGVRVRDADRRHSGEHAVDVPLADRERALG